VKPRSHGNSGTALILPSYNSGPQLEKTLQGCLEHHAPVLVVIDASVDGSAEQAERSVPGLGETWFLLRHERNVGKGAAVLTGLRWARDRGFTSALVVDADGQHPLDHIAEFITLGARFPQAMILGVPIFGPEAPAERVQGRKIGNWWTNLATLWGGIGDSLFGFRLYPVRESLAIMERIKTARRFDFDTELAVRLYWAGVRPINRHVPVFYPPAGAGGVSHFRYLRDNLLLLSTHTRLFFGMLLRLPRLWRFRRRPPLAP
jgi:glycosyltransferase involved in cell wall biosynthesis